MEKLLLASPTITDAAIAWLDARGEVADSTRASYRGEADRFGQYAAAHGVLLVADVTEAHWLEYLADLMSARPSVGSRRKDALTRSSALQAARITRSFLRHCQLHGWIGWSPGINPRRCPVPAPPTRTPSPPAALRIILLACDSLDDQGTARRRCAIALAFWGGLKPRELAALRDSDLTVRRDGTGELRVAGRETLVECPAELIAVVQAYQQSRDTASGEAGANEYYSQGPLLAQLGSRLAIIPHSAWQLTKSWPGRGRREGTALGSKMIRDCYTALASVEANRVRTEVARQTGRRTKARDSECPASKAIRIDQVRSRLRAEDPPEALTE